jgi:hypothetical protein
MLGCELEMLCGEQRGNGAESGGDTVRKAEGTRCGKQRGNGAESGGDMVRKAEGTRCENCARKLGRILCKKWGRMLCETRARKCRLS